MSLDSLKSKSTSNLHLRSFDSSSIQRQVSPGFENVREAFREFWLVGNTITNGVNRVPDPLVLKGPGLESTSCRVAPP
jgi:hypothetical protein